MRHVILAFLVVMALIAYVQRAAISVPLEEIGRDLAVANPTWALGLLQSAWQLGYAVCQLPSGGVADRFGARRTVICLAVLWSLATGLTAFAPSYWSVVAAWTAMGVLQAGAFPCAVRTIGRTFGDLERARASGWLGAGMFAGGAIAPVLTAWLLQRFAGPAAAAGLSPWRLCLATYALPGFAWAAVYWLASRGTAADDKPAAAATPTASTDSPSRVSWGQAFADPSLQLLCSQQFLRAGAMVFFITWFPTFLRETRGVSLMQSGLLTTYAGAASLLGAILGGYASDQVLVRTGSKRLARQGLATIGMAACSALMAASLFVSDVNGAIALISVGAFVATFGGVAGYTVAIDYGGERVGTVFGAMNTAGNLGAMLFPVTIGWLVSATGTWNAALVAFVVMMAVDAVLWAVLNPQHTFLAGPTPATAEPA
ncbi:MAG: MFS transporter [Pirellulales bacterium]